MQRLAIDETEEHYDEPNPLWIELVLDSPAQDVEEAEAEEAEPLMQVDDDADLYDSRGSLQSGERRSRRGWISPAIQSVKKGGSWG